MSLRSGKKSELRKRTFGKLICNGLEILEHLQDNRREELVDWTRRGPSRGRSGLSSSLKVPGYGLVELFLRAAEEVFGG
jgi:hypothetical protein